MKTLKQHSREELVIAIREMCDKLDAPGSIANDYDIYTAILKELNIE